ncbi:ferredoxin [Micromonospora polyrhachis]|uniref:Ferredoxin n=1 Tax=Micromonospora polyrhachis TaxID=1282883 RepID=A0A7W7ST27_9ACTN|nr:ferredoxin [Micromonospora polyrhachis]MBB4960475.1 ferredoxin [Micromonospora polyrhachis]
MRVRVDMNRCETHAQCVFAAPDVFRLDDNDELVYDSAPDDSLRPDIEQAMAACPVQAILIAPS